MNNLAILSGALVEYTTIYQSLQALSKKVAFDNQCIKWKRKKVLTSFKRIEVLGSKMMAKVAKTNSSSRCRRISGRSKPTT